MNTNLFFYFLDLLFVTTANAQCQLEKSYRLDCLPEQHSSHDYSTIANCRSRGCCYDPNAGENVPKCFYPKGYIDYKVYSMKELPNGFTLKLKVNGKLPIWPPNQSMQLQVDVNYLTESILRVTVADADGIYKTYVNEETLESPLPFKEGINEQKRNYDIDFSIDSFGFVVRRRKTGTAIFNTTFSNLIFAHRFKQISTLLPSAHIYGLAEHNARMYLNNGSRQVFTFFNRGEQPEERDDPQFNLYGYHPYYLLLEEDGNFNGVYFHNTNGLDIVLQPGTSLTYRTVGGNLDFFFFLGPTADDVVSQYTSIIGRPFLPPYWALGFHLCRYDYRTTNRTREAWQRTIDAKIPFDVQWNDIDYMDKRKDFTIDPVGYDGLNNFVQDVHKKDMKYIINISPGLSNVEPEGTYEPFERAVKEKLFITDPYTEKPMVGKCWQNETVYLDFSNPATVTFWEEELLDFHKELNFDALWLDMNEPYNFFTMKQMGCDRKNELENIPYLPGGDPLSNSTLCMYGKMYKGDHFDLHTLYSYYETKATYSALRKIHPEKRPWIISRSSTAGQGRYSSHWNGDITAEWPTMRRTISNMLTFNMIGMPLIGADICGFMKNTTADLCLRWHQLGAFYTFSRNHNDFDTIDHDPVAMGTGVVNAARESLQLRYLLLPYLYTLFYKSHLFGHSVARPLFFEFSNDKKTVQIDEQFMWGSAIMFNPILFQEHDFVKTYYPEGHWFSNFKNEIVGPVTKFIETHIEKPNINFRAGHIVPTQEPSITTVASRSNPFGLIVYIDPVTNSASGDLYWDDGETYQSSYTHVNFNLTNTESSTYTLTTEADVINYNIEALNLAKVTFLNVKQLPKLVLCNLQEIKKLTIVDNQLIISLDDQKLSLQAKNVLTITF